MQAGAECEEEQFFAEIKYEAEDQDELLEKQDLFTRIQLGRNDYEEIKNLIVSGESGLIGNIDQGMVQDEDLQISQGADGNITTNLKESARDLNYNTLDYCIEETPTKFTNNENKIAKRSKRLINRKIQEKNTPNTDVMEVDNVNSIPLKRTPASAATEIVKSTPQQPKRKLPNRKTKQQPKRKLPNRKTKQQPKRKLPNRKTKHSDFEMNENECPRGEAGKINVKVSWKGTTNMAKEYTSSMEENLNERSGDNKAGNLTQLKRIKAVHERVKYSCDKCDLTYISKSNLSKHKKTEHEGIRYNCDKCDYQTKHKSWLSQHMKGIHEGASYRCEKCDYKSKFQCNLAVHMKVEHDGVSYSCKKCDFVSKYKSLVKHHMLAVHEGIRYACEKCVFQSKQKSKLKIHIQAEHEGIMYSCGKCDFQTKYKSSLSTHMKIQHEGFWHACEECDYKSKVKSNLSKHMLRIHKGKG